MQESISVQTDLSSAYQYHHSVYTLARWKRRLLRKGVVYMAHKGRTRWIFALLAVAMGVLVSAAAFTSVHPLIVTGLVLVGVVIGICSILKLLDVI